VTAYERLWNERFDLMDNVLEELKETEQSDGSDD
jgi:hypothetical protein